MLILSLDTSSVTASCALAEDGVTLAESFLNAKITHSATLLPMIDSMLSNAKRDISDVGMLAAANGPGSFTGVRIGASVLLGLAHGKNIPCIGVSALHTVAYAYNGVFNGMIICPVMDARRGQFYNALFKDGKRLTEDRAISAGQLQAELLSYGAPVVLCGDGYRLASQLLTGVKTVAPPADLIYPRAANICRVAMQLYGEAEDKTVFTDLNFKPVYLRPSQAERNLNNENS